MKSSEDVAIVDGSYFEDHGKLRVAQVNSKPKSGLAYQLSPWYTDVAKSMCANPSMYHLQRTQRPTDAYYICLVRMRLNPLASDGVEKEIARYITLGMKSKQSQSHLARTVCALPHHLENDGVGVC